MRKSLFGILGVWVFASVGVALAAEEIKKEDEKKVEATATTAPAPAASAQPAAATGAKKKEFKAYRFDGSIITLDQSLGLGSFVSNEFARNTLYSLSLDLQPKYSLTDKLYLYGRLIISKELTNSFATGTTYPGQVTISDLILDVGYSKFWEPVKDLTFSAAMRFWLPTSLASQYTNLVAGIGPGFSVSYKLSKFSFMYSFRARKNFNTTTGPTVASNDDLVPVRNGGAEAISADQTAVGGNNVEWTLYNTVKTDVAFTDKLSLTMMIIFMNSFTYDGYPIDGTSAPGAKPGRGQRDTTWGIIDVSYSLTDHWGLSLGISSMQSARTSDGQSFRFPFFDWRSYADNNTSFYFDVSYTF